MAALALEDLSGLLDSPFPAPPETSATVHRILARKRQFGISRLGSVTGLDRIGIPVVQVIRPGSRSVAVNQGKGLTYAQAAISGLMESLEGWASERIASERTWQGCLAAVDHEGIWSYLLEGVPAGEHRRELGWIEGWDLIGRKPRPAPLALVDTAYTIPSPHPCWLPRNSAGLAAGTTLHQAIAHACFELLERHGRCMAMRTPHYFDRFQIDTLTIRTGTAGEIVQRLTSAGFVVGVWSIPCEHHLPVYWCHLMEGASHPPLAPLPAAGFGCDANDDRALTKALLEACQSRLGAIAATREDVTANFYAATDDRELSAWRQSMSRAGASFPDAGPAPGNENDLRTGLEALRVAGASAVIAVVLYADRSIPLHIVRVIAPPLPSNPEDGHEA
jgi:ribosomal protein S12 methylthiotransferase accessory factor